MRSILFCLALGVGIFNLLASWIVERRLEKQWRSPTPHQKPEDMLRFRLFVNNVLWCLSLALILKP